MTVLTCKELHLTAGVFKKSQTTDMLDVVISTLIYVTVYAVPLSSCVYFI